MIEIEIILFIVLLLVIIVMLVIIILVLVFRLNSDNSTIADLTDEIAGDIVDEILD